MDSIQEMIDEHMMEIPAALAKKLLEACKAKAEAEPKLYKLTWTMVSSHAHVVEVEDEPDFALVELSHKTQTLIVEAVDELVDHPNGHGGKLQALKMPNHGMFLKSWLQMSKPKVLMDELVYGRSNCRKDYMVIIHSIEPYTLKRSHE